VSDNPLSRELHRAFDRRHSRERKLTKRQIADEAGLKYGYVRQLFAGGIDKPPPEFLAKLAPTLGLPPERLLTLTDQLGAAAGLPKAPSTDLVGEVAALLAQQNELLVRLIAGIDQARAEATGEREALAKTLGEIRATLIPSESGGASGRKPPVGSAQ
jgi:transcriptional regulator with XRE-family HTH domain